MTLPFIEEEFPALFGAYNAALWPFALLLWLATAAALALVACGFRAWPAAPFSLRRPVDDVIITEHHERSAAPATAAGPA